MMKKWNSLLTLLMAVLLVFGLSGCGSSAQKPAPDAAQAPEQSQGQDQKQDQGQNQGQEKPAAFPVTVKDSSGKEVKIEKEPQKIISIIPSSTEIAFALGLGKKIVGVSEWDNYPEEVKNIEKIGDLNVSTEKVVSLQPDLILANSSNGKAVDALRKLGLTVLVNDATSLNGTYENIRTIAKATGTTEQAEDLIKKMEAEKDEVVKAVSDIPQDKRKKVWIEIDPTLYTAGKDTFMNELIQLAGGKNIMDDLTGWPQVSEEKVLQRNPDVILTTYGYYVKDAVAKVKARKTWQNVNAVKNGQVFDVNADLVNRPGPRITEGLKEIAKALYPDRFAK